MPFWSEWAGLARRGSALVVVRIELRSSIPNRLAVEHRPSNAGANTRPDGATPHKSFARKTYPSPTQAPWALALPAVRVEIQACHWGGEFARRFRSLIRLSQQPRQAMPLGWTHPELGG